MARGTRSPVRVETCKGPRPPVKGPFFTVARGLSDAIRASERVSPASDGEGQALALREGAALFYRSAGARHRDVERFMKPTHLILPVL